MSISAEIDTFFERVEGREVNSELTLEAYERWVRRFELWHSGDLDENDLRQFDTMLDSEDYSDYPWRNLRGPPAPDSYAYRSRKQALSAVKLWVEKYHGVEIETEVQNIVKGEAEPFDPQVLDESEVSEVIQSGSGCSVDGCKAALQVSYDAILRGSELVLIRSEDVNLSDGTLYVQATKGSSNRTIALDDRTVSLLRQHMDRFGSRNRLFYNTYGRPWTASAWNAHVRRYHHPAGSHALFRHSSICHRLNGGEPLSDVYRRARHHNLQTTMQYASVVGVDVDTSSLPTKIDG